MWILVNESPLHLKTNRTQIVVLGPPIGTLLLCLRPVRAAWRAAPCEPPFDQAGLNIDA
jgi:hypothetical protein